MRSIMAGRFILKGFDTNGNPVAHTHHIRFNPTRRNIEKDAERLLCNMDSQQQYEVSRIVYFKEGSRLMVEGDVPGQFAGASEVMDEWVLVASYGHSVFPNDALIQDRLATDTAPVFCVEFQKRTGPLKQMRYHTSRTCLCNMMLAVMDDNGTPRAHFVKQILFQPIVPNVMSQAEKMVKDMVGCDTTQVHSVRLRNRSVGYARDDLLISYNMRINSNISFFPGDYFCVTCFLRGWVPCFL